MRLRWPWWSLRIWHDASATVDLAAGQETWLRWRYDSDGLYQGRGLYVDAVPVVGSTGLLLDDSLPGALDDFVTEGWEVSDN